MKNNRIYSLQLVVCSGIMLLLNCLLCTLCYAKTISSAELINNAKRYDGKTVVYTGEVIGEVMLRNRGIAAWVNVLEGSNAIGIWLGKELMGFREGHIGNYKSRGDIIEIEGVFHRSCLEHGGDLDIHALNLSKVSDGADMPETINTVKRNLVIILAGGLCLVLILNRLKRK